MSILRVLWVVAFCAAVQTESHFDLIASLDAQHSTAQRLLRARVRRSAENAKTVPEEEKGYAVVVDAGSSGSRVYMYWWRQPPNTTWQLLPHTRLEFVTTSDGQMATFNIDRSKGGGISEAYERAAREGNRTAEHPTKVALEEYLAPILNYTTEFIPAAKRSSTPIFIWATVCPLLIVFLFKGISF